MADKTDLFKGPPPQYNPTAPITDQPIKGWSDGSAGDPTTSRNGVEAIGNFLSRLNDSKNLFIEQKFQMCEIMTGWARENKFTVWQDRDMAPFYGKEESSCICRQFAGDRRAFACGIKDGRNNVLLKVERPLNCSMFCGSLFPDSLVIKLGNEQVLGYVKEKVNFVPHFAVKNGQGQTIFELKARLIPATFHTNDQVAFNILDGLSKKVVGRIVKHWGGCCQEWFTSADKFTIEFAEDWSPETKALLLGTLFLINMRHFENCCGFVGNLICRGLYVKPE